MVITVPKPDGSQQPQVAHPIKYSNYSPDYKYTGGAIGEDTRHILQELGYTESRIDELKEHAVIKEAE